MIIYRTTRTCARCGHPVGCMGRDWYAENHNELVAVDCETGKLIEHCPICGNGGRWWEEEATNDNQ